MQLSQEIKKNIFYVSIYKYSGIFFQLIIGAVLARLLKPEEFGTVAVVLVFSNFFSLLTDLGIGSAIIQLKNLRNTQISALFLITIIYSTFLAICFFLSGNLIAKFYNNIKYQEITQLLAVSLFFYSISNIPEAILKKENNFRLIGKIELSIQFFSGLIAVFLAFNGYSYYAIIYRQIIISTLIFIFKYHYSRIILFNKYDFYVISEIFNYSFFQFLSNSVFYLSRNFDNLIIGKFLGESSLGYYDKAYTLIMMPIGNISRIINNVLHPSLSIHQENKELIFQTFNRISKFLLIFGLPLSIFLFFTAKELIIVIYGPQWERSIDAFKYLSLSISLQLVIVSSGSIFLVLGKTFYLFINGVFSSILIIISVIVGVICYNSISITAILLSISYIFIFYQCFYLLIVKSFNLSYWNFLKSFLPALKISLLVIIINLILEQLLFTNIIYSLIIKFLFSSISFIISLKIFKELEGFLNVFKLKNQEN